MPKSRWGRIRQKFVRRFILIVLKGLMVAVRLLPQATARSLGGSLGGAAFYLLATERHRGLRQIEAAMKDSMDEEQRRETVRSSFRNLGKSLFEVLCLSRMTQAEVERSVEIEGEKSLKEAKERGQGVIFVTGHLGNWEIGAASLSRRYHPTAIVAAPIYDSRIEALMTGVRKRHGIETIVRNEPRALRRILSSLRSGGVVVFAIDQDTRADGVFVPFFGRQAYTPAGPATLALRTGAAVVMGFSLRLPDDRHRVVIIGPMDLVRTGHPAEDVRENTARFSEVIERYVREHPDQWVWMHKRWKTVESH
jgi:Kdo2-lipid IVA lauroyltransferase/acyltransferase